MGNCAMAMPLVITFLKAPRPGLVKTRLGRDIGFDQALRVYRALAESQIRRLPPAVGVQISYAPRGAAAEMKSWLGRRLLYRAQVGGGLGERLQHAFATAFRRGFGPVLAIGADCPALDCDTIERAIGLLGRNDVVLGPASDGGYYLVGLRWPTTGIFRDVPWSTDQVLETTLARIAEAGLTGVQLEVKDDLDTLSDLRRFMASDLSADLPADIRLATSA